MSQAARLSQAEINRAMKAAQRFPSARVVLDHRRQRIEIVLGEAAKSAAPNPWDEEDA